MGMSAHFMQRSTADERNNRAGDRSYYWSKDIQACPSSESSRGKLLVIIDTDFHAEMEQVLIDHEGPALLYTINPTATCGIGDGYTWTFNHDSEIVMGVTGGADYKHALWNYNKDVVTLYKYSCGLPVKAITYIIERRTISELREYVLLVPIAHHGFCSAWAMTWLKSESLERLTVAYGDYLRLDVLKLGHNETHLIRHHGRVMNHIDVAIPVKLDNHLAALSRVSRNPITVSQVERILSVTGGDNNMGAALYCEIIRSQDAFPRTATIFPVDAGMRNYVVTDSMSEYDDAQHGLEPFMSPLLGRTCVPAACRANDAAGVSNRITKVKSPFKEITPFMERVTMEFIGLCIHEKHGLAPCDVDDVFDNQSRPSQQAILREASDGIAWSSTAKTFMKREAGDSDPRIISTQEPGPKLEYSQVIYPLAAECKTHRWYAFGKTSAEIAGRVSEICKNAGVVSMTDFSRMDGRVSQLLRVFERKFLLYAFHPRYHQQVLDLHVIQYGVRARTTQGVTYKTGFSRLSGSPETSLFNTICNAFIAYHYLRTQKIDGVFIQPEDAFSRLGIYGGDDGLMAGDNVLQHSLIADAWGQKLTYDVVQYGDVGVTFLARLYSPDVWYGDDNSMADVSRFLRKLHLSKKLPIGITPLMKIVEKLRSAMNSDLQTPIIGKLAKKLMTLTDICPVEEADSRIVTWASKMPGTGYPNEDSGWMMDRVIQLMPDFSFDTFEDFLENCHSTDVFLRPPECSVDENITLKMSAIVDGEYHSPPEATEPTVEPDQPSAAPAEAVVTTKKKSPATRRRPKGRPAV
jgi:hypothetical protein